MGRQVTWCIYTLNLNYTSTHYQGLVDCFLQYQPNTVINNTSAPHIAIVSYPCVWGRWGLPVISLVAPPGSAIRPISGTPHGQPRCSCRGGPSLPYACWSRSAPSPASNRARESMWRKLPSSAAGCLGLALSPQGERREERAGVGRGREAGGGLHLKGGGGGGGTAGWVGLGRKGSASSSVHFRWLPPVQQSYVGYSCVCVQMWTPWQAVWKFVPSLAPNDYWV